MGEQADYELERRMRSELDDDWGYLTARELASRNQAYRRQKREDAIDLLSDLTPEAYPMAHHAPPFPQDVAVFVDDRARVREVARFGIRNAGDQAAIDRERQRAIDDIRTGRVDPDGLDGI